MVHVHLGFSFYFFSFYLIVNRLWFWQASLLKHYLLTSYLWFNVNEQEVDKIWYRAQKQIGSKEKLLKNKEL